MNFGTSKVNGVVQSLRQPKAAGRILPVLLFYSLAYGFLFALVHRLLQQGFVDMAAFFLWSLKLFIRTTPISAKV